MDVLVFGSANVDFICYVSRLPKSGETLHGYKFSTGFGGKGANQCVAAAKMGAKTAMIAKVGDDSWGNDFIENFRKENVNVDFVEKIPKQTTGIAQINVSDDGSNQIVIVNGANDLLSKNDVNNAAILFDNSKVLVCQLETPLAATIEAVRSFTGISIVNAAPAIENIPKELLTLSTIFCVNESEASLITKQEVITINDAKRAVEKLIEMGGNTIILTLGEKGIVFSDKINRKTIHMKARKIEKVIDTTGAGDAFIGSLAYFLSKFPKDNLCQQVGAACEIASISVQYPGTQSSFPNGKDLQTGDLIQQVFEWVDLNESVK